MRLTQLPFALGVLIMFLLPQFVEAQTRSIMGEPSASLETMQKWAKRNNATEQFISLASIYYEKATDIGLNPVVAYCQAAQETGFGKFRGVVKPSFNNPCGLKTRHARGDLHTDHAQFASWEDGVMAHIDHLALYAGAPGYPKAKDNTKDPRHFAEIAGVCPNVENLSGRWAKDKNYSRSILKMMRQLENME
jgi:flagellum-specific peptidoglycan hydrolase FlgJ